MDGKLLGVWTHTAEPGSRYKALGDGGCVINLLRRNFSGGILFLGDSQDHYVRTPYCWHVGMRVGTESHPASNKSSWIGDRFYHPHDHDHLNHCITANGLVLGHFYLPVNTITQVL